MVPVTTVVRRRRSHVDHDRLMMRPRARRWRVLRLSMLATVVACTATPDRTADPRPATHAEQRTGEDTWDFTDFPLPTPTRVDSGGFDLVEIARYGTADGAEALGNVTAVAVTDEVLVTSDMHQCEITVFSRRTQRALSRFGRCGQGPEEFQNFHGGVIAARGKQILAVDAGARRMRVFSHDGQVLRSVTLDSTAVPIGSDLAAVHWMGDQLIGSLNLPSHQRRGTEQIARLPDEPMVRVLDATSGRVRDTVLVNGPAVARESFGLMRTTRVCALPTAGESPIMLAVNVWSAQLLIFRSHDDVLLNTRFDVVGDRRMTDARRGATVPATVYWVACGDSVALVAANAVTADNSSPERGTLVLVDPHRGVLRRRVVDDTQPGLRGRLVAAHGQRFFFRHDDRFDWPLIIEYELRLR